MNINNNLLGVSVVTIFVCNVLIIYQQAILYQKIVQYVKDMNIIITMIRKLLKNICLVEKLFFIMNEKYKFYLFIDFGYFIN